MKRALALALASWLVAGPLLAETVRVTASAANVRSGPSTASKIVGSAPHGTVLEVLEKSGDWRKVHSADAGIEGWIHGRLLEPVRAAPAAAEAAKAPAAAPLVIEHKDVGCLLAGQYAKLEACVGPTESVGRAQVQFRASGTSPWYAVDMVPDGACLATWLPKPKPETASVEYFVWAADKSFAESARPEKAPGAAFTPRVVRKKADCDSLKALLAFAAKQAPKIVVHAVRDAGGKVLEAAASHGLEAAGGLAGFSPDGVVMASTGAAPGQASASSGGAGAGAATAGGISTKTLAIVGGGVAAVGLVAIAAKGGGGSGNGGSTPTTQAPQSLSGRWGGTVSSGAGLSLQIFVTGGNCTYKWDIDGNLVQSGNVLTGPASAVRRSITCNPSSPELEKIIAPLVPATESFTLNGTLAPPSGISIPVGDALLTGTYTATTIQAKASQATTDHTSDYVLNLTKR